MSKLRKNNEVEKSVRYIDDLEAERLILGTTRSGSGETYIIPEIDIYLKSERKHTLVVNDPKGELMEICKEVSKD